MQNLSVIENDLVPVYETSTGERVVYGTELHKVLEVGRDFSTWVKCRLEECDAVEKQDYYSFPQNGGKPNGGRPKMEYIIKLDTAKEMAMLERNEKGKQVRRYFINVEKKYKEQTRRLTVSEQIMIIAQGNVELDQKIDAVKQELDDFKQDMPLLAVECDRITAAVQKRGVEVLGGKESNAYRDSSLRSKVYQDIHRELKRQFGVSTYKAIKRIQCDIANSIIEAYEPPIVLQNQIADCNAQVNMEVA